MNTLVLEYSRQPMTTNYIATICGGHTDEVTKAVECTSTLNVLTEVKLPEILEALQSCMIEYPDARVFMLQTPYQEKSTRILPMHELSEDMKELIRNRLPEAIRAFSPIVVKRLE
jgi:hypothetical protein